MAVGHQTVIADAWEAGRKSVQQEAADELRGGNGHHFGLLGLAVVFPAERNLSVLQGQQTLIGDSYAMGVAPRYSNTCWGPPNGGLA